MLTITKKQTKTKECSEKKTCHLLFNVIFEWNDGWTWKKIWGNVLWVNCSPCAKCGANLKKSTKTLTGGGSSHSPLIVPYSNSYCVISSLLKFTLHFSKYLEFPLWFLDVHVTPPPAYSEMPAPIQSMTTEPSVICRVCQQLINIRGREDQLSSAWCLITSIPPLFGLNYS